MVELMVTIVIFAVLAAVAIPSFSGYYKNMDMINANESARQIYGIAQNKLSAMKVAGQLQEDQLEKEYGLFDVLPSESAATTASVDGIQYYYMNRDAAIAFLDQAGQKLDEKLINKQASIVIEIDPKNGYVYGVFYATYPKSNEKAFDYEGTGGIYDLQKGTEEFRASDALRSQGKARIGYYGGESALLEYEAGLKTPLIEIVNDEELILKISSYHQPTDFTGYQVTITGIKDPTDLFGSPYEYTYYIEKNDFARDLEGVTLNGNHYNLLLDSLAFDGFKHYSIKEILETQFTKLSSSDYKPCNNIEISVEAVSKSAEGAIIKRSFPNVDEVSSLFAEKTKDDDGNDIITVSNARHLQNLNRIPEDNLLNNSSTQVIQNKDIDWQKTIQYYKTLDTWAPKDRVNNALENRIQKDGENAKFTSIPDGRYKYSAKKPEGGALVDSTKAGYLISNLPIVGVENGGLFATYSGPLLEHINLVNVIVEGTKNVGALVGEYNAISGNKLLNCSVYLDKDLSSDPAFSYNSYSVKGGSESTGGLVGVIHSGTIQNSFAAINVKGTSGVAGGLVGRSNHANITHSYATGQVSGVQNGIALGGFVGVYKQDTMAGGSISNCYTTSEITSMKPVMGSFVGKYEGTDSDINITKSYATGALVSVLNWESVTQIDFIGGNPTGTVQADCFYLGNEDSNGAMGLNIEQLTGFEEIVPGKKIYSKDDNTSNDIYTKADGWRYPDNFGVGTISEPDLAHPLTHPYYLDQRLSEVDDKVYPYPGLNDIDVAKASIPHYGDWSKTKENLGGGSYIFYYEKYANNEYGVYYWLKGASAVNTLRPDDKISKWGYGIIAKESELNAPMDIYRRNADKSGTLLAADKKIMDWVDRNALTVNNVSLNSSFRFYAFLDTSMKTFLDSIQDPSIQYLYTIISSANLYNMFNPCFATAVNSEAVGNINPNQMPVMSMGTANEPFKIRHAEHFYYMGNKGYDGVESEYFYFEQTRYVDFQDNFIYKYKAKENTSPPQLYIYSFKDNFYPKADRYNGEFTPANPFVGVYNGNGFDIRGYVRYSYWESYQLQYDGLFGYVGDGSGKGQISNVNLHVKSVDLVVKDALYAGIFAGYIGEKSAIHNCHITITNNENIEQPVKIWKYPGIPFGGFVGSSSGNISNSSLNSEKPFACTYYITEEKNEKEKESQGIKIEKLQREGSLGGFAGENKTTGTMYECQVKVNGYIGSDTSSIAGFVGKNENVIQKCNVIIGDRIKAAFAYGFVGRNNNSGYILDCKVNSKFLESINYSYAVGFAGSNEGTIKSSHVNITKILGAKTYGFALENVPEKDVNAPNYKPSIVDCTVASELLGTEGDYGAESVGFVGKNNGEILRGGVTVTKEMNAQKVYGFAVENNIKGSITGSTLLCNKINASNISYGFVCTNDGLISNVTAQNNENLGQNIAYGFIYTNSVTGIIKDGVLRGNSISSNNELYGFVWENNGFIEGAQVFIEGNPDNNTSGELSSRIICGFAYSNFNTIKDSTLVCNAIIGSGDVCGFARENKGLIENAQVTIVGTDNVNITGILNGQNTYGFVYANYNEIKNSTLVCNAIIGSGEVFGFARENWDLIVNAKVDIVRNNYGNTAAIIKGQNVYGFMYQNHTDAIIQDSSISSENASASGKIFGFAYENNGIIKSEITGCYADIPIVTQSYEWVAGFVNINTGSILGKVPDAETNTIFIEYKGNTIETNGKAAGFVLDNQGTIEYAAVHSEVTADINTTGDSAGFVLENKGSIKNCYTKSNLTSPTGNIAGFVSDNKNDIQNCYNQGVLCNIFVDWNLCIGGFAYKTSGNISNCFSISSVMNEEQGNEAITAGFAALVNGGTITNSYAITKNDNVNSAPYVFSKNTTNITNCFYLDWDGISDAKQIDMNTSAEAKKMSELEKLVEENILPSNIWQTNYKVTTHTYTYPTIIGLPLPNYNPEFEPDPPSWTVSGGDVTGGDVTSGDITSGNVYAGDVTGGDRSD